MAACARGEPGLVFIVGLARDYCVQASAIDAAVDGFAAVVLDDLTRPMFPDRRSETDDAWRTAGVTVSSTSDLRG